MKDQKVVDLAMFIENINAVLGERDPDIQQYRHQILKKLKCCIKDLLIKSTIISIVKLLYKIAPMDRKKRILYRG